MIYTVDDVDALEKIFDKALSLRDQTVADSALNLITIIQATIANQL